MPYPGPIEAATQQRQAERLAVVMAEAAMRRVEASPRPPSGRVGRVLNTFGEGIGGGGSYARGGSVSASAYALGYPKYSKPKPTPAQVRVQRIPLLICAVWGKSDAFVDRRIRRYRRLKNSRGLSLAEVQEKAVKSCSFKYRGGDVPLCVACMGAVVDRVFAD